MSKLNNVWVITDRPAAYAELCTGARALGEKVTLVYAGDRSSAVGADKAYYLGSLADARWPDYIPAIISLIRENAPELALLGVTKNCRLTAALLGAALGVGVLTDANDISAENGVTGRRMVYGGAGLSRERTTGATAVVCAANGAFDADACLPVADIVDVEPSAPAAGIRCTGVKAAEVSGVNLAAAKRIVGVGRGFSEEVELDIARDFARVVGAELGCTRPVAEESKWLPRETYIGISGVMVKPDLYFALGLSGQVQHTVGISQSGAIVAVNKDENAPIFKCCDYGIVGDMKKIVPALAAVIESSK